MKQFIIFTLLAQFCSLCMLGQNPVWVNTISSSNIDEGFSIDTDTDGNVYLAGRFSGTADFNPSSAVYNLTSNGLTDIYLAKYSSSGQFIWAFNLGSTSYDAAQKVKINNAGEILITGYYRNSVDFDPGPGSFMMNGSGLAGTDVGFSGDIYVAKYTSNGGFIWAFEIRGSYSHDKGEGIDIDNNDNIYLAGAVNTTSTYPIDADPGPGVYDIGGTGKGNAFVAKYTTNASFLWAFNIGGYGLNSGANKIKLTPGDTTFIVTGFFSGTNVDFDPNAGSYIRNSNGAEDLLIAKYSINKNFLWAYTTGGTGPDVGLEVDIDQQKDIYISGWFNGINIDFNPSMSSTNLSSNGGLDAFILKYSKNGGLVWARSFGGTLDDIAWSLSLNIVTLNVSGEFNDIVDLDPGLGTFNRTSNGGSDIFISQFDTTGNFLCGGSIGGIQNERGYSIKTVHADSFLLCGNYNTNNIDFDPGLTSLIKTNLGQSDGFLVKYFSQSTPIVLTPIMTSDTICIGEVPQLVIDFGAGVAGPVTIVLNDGITNTSYSNILSGVSFTPIPIPITTTTYSLTAINSNNSNCQLISFPLGVTATITVNPLPTITANATPNPVCAGNSTTCIATGGLTYNWTGGITNGIPFIPVTNNTYTVTGTSASGCTSTNLVSVNVVDQLEIDINSSDMVLCLGDSLQLTATGATTYLWSPGIDISSTSVPDPLVFPSSTSTYFVTGTDANGCTGTASILIEVVANPRVIASKSADVECNNHTIILSATGASSYSWSPAAALSFPNSATTGAIVYSPTTFVVTAKVGSCVVIDSVNVDVYNNEESSIFIPTAFSPNDDGKNDCLRVRQLAKFSKYYFSIYNRWGQRVFEADNPNDCWNGYFNNTQAPVSTYYYFLEGETKCGKVFKKGDITLVR